MNQFIDLYAMMSPEEFTELLQKSHRSNNTVLMKDLKGSIKKELLIFKDHIEKMVSDTLKEANAKINNLQSQIIEKEEELFSLRTALDISNSETSKLSKKLLTLNNRIEELNKRAIHFDSYSRKRNVILFKVAETENNNFELIKLIHNCVKNSADLHFKESDIDSVHRIGKKGRFPRPVLLTLTKIQKRNQILSKSRNFTNNGIRIDEDLSKNILTARKPIYKLANHLRKNGKRTTFRKEKFFVDGVEWNYDKIEMALNELSSQNQV